MPKFLLMNNAYFFDIDGTIYDSQFHGVDPLLYDEIAALRQNGDDVYLLSSRSVLETVHLPEAFKKAEFTGIILDGGGSVFDTDWNLVKSTPVDPESLKKLAAYCKERNLCWRWSGPRDNCFETNPPFEVRELWRQLYLMVPPVRSWQGEEVCNLLVFASDEQTASDLAEMFADSPLVVYDNCIEIRAAGVSKEATAAALKQEKGYDSIICAGDGMNDVEMLKIADYALSVENGCEQAKAAADIVVAEPKNGGIAHWLQEMRKKNEQTTAD